MLVNDRAGTAGSAAQPLAIRVQCPLPRGASPMFGINLCLALLSTNSLSK